jgi:cytochrome P450
MPSVTTADQVPTELVVDFDIFDPNLCVPDDTIQARIAEMAERGPLVFSTAHGGHWVVTHYQEVHDVLHDPKTFSSYPNSLVNAGQGALLPLEADPPEHTAYRGVLQPLFSPQRMKELEPEIRAIVTELIDGFIEDGQAEFVSDFAHELPARVFLALMGLPYEDAPKFTEWSETILRGEPGGTAEESEAARTRVIQELAAYFGAVIAEHRGQTVEDDSDVVTVAVNTPIEIGGETRVLTDEELIQLFMLTLLGGLHTTQGSLGWGIMHMSGSPDARRRLIENPELLEDAVEEILRIEAAPFPGRRATRDVELGGVQIKKDDMLMLSLCGANRDAEQFPHPNEVSFDRKPNRHLTFGGGRHRCIGSHLARRQLTIAFEEIHKRLPDYELAGKPQFHSSQTRGVLAMPIRFTPGERSPGAEATTAEPSGAPGSR